MCQRSCPIAAVGPLGDLLAADPDPATVIRLGNGETVSFDDRDLMAAINSVDHDQIAEVVVERPSVRRLYERVIDSDGASGASAGKGSTGKGNASTEADSDTGDETSSADD